MLSCSRTWGIRHEPWSLDPELDTGNLGRAAYAGLNVERARQASPCRARGAATTQAGEILSQILWTLVAISAWRTFAPTPECHSYALRKRSDFRFDAQGPHPAFYSTALWSLRSRSPAETP